MYDADPALARHFEQALQAHALYKRDRDYIVKDGEIIIVDEFTGRQMPGRRWSEGLHQAVEAKEGLRVQRESVTMATVTFQNYFRLYDKLAGMTGTAMTEAEEFHKIYSLEVVAIPTHRPMIRDDEADLVFRNEMGKFNSLIDEIVEMSEAGRPVLVGTVSVAKSEILSEMLKRRGIKHETLNAKFHEKELGIVAQAGKSGAVTIATNMAGRGTDIKLGGEPSGLASDLLHQRGLNPAEVDKDTYATVLAEAKAICDADHEVVVAAGGLHIIGTERHDSRRIDNQLRGRAGRQGDPGSSRFYLSLDDDLMKRFASERVAGLMERMGLEDDVAIESRLVSKTIESAQTRVEGFNFDIRKRVVEFDDVINKQRETIYSERDKVLRNEDLGETVRSFLDEEVDSLVDQYCSDELPEDWNVEGLTVAIHAMGLDGAGTRARTISGTAGAREAIRDHIRELVDAKLEAKSAEIGEADWPSVERVILLRTIDSPVGRAPDRARRHAPRDRPARAMPSRIRSSSSGARPTTCTPSCAASSAISSRLRSCASRSPARTRSRRSPCPGRASRMRRRSLRPLRGRSRRPAGRAAKPRRAMRSSARSPGACRRHRRCERSRSSSATK